MTQCILWGGWVSKNGYGLEIVAGSVRLAHREAYTRACGQIPRGLDLDHLCRNRSCVNPEHLEPVTRKENLRRGLKGPRTKCPQGHLYGAYKRPDGTNRCRECELSRNAAARRRRAVQS